MVDYKNIMRVAHRGGALLAPENTLAAFKVGITHQSNALELDLHLSNDGELMVIHDPLLERTTGVQGEVSAYSAFELQQFNAAQGTSFSAEYDFEKIPTFREVLELVIATDDTLYLQVEIKVDQNGNRYPKIEERIIELLHEYQVVEQTVIISFDFPSLQRIKELEPTLQIGALISKQYFSAYPIKTPALVADDIAALGAEYVGLNYQYLTPQLRDEFRRVGVKIGVWTVNETEAILKMANLGVDFITSDRPDLLKELLDKPCP